MKNFKTNRGQAHRVIIREAVDSLPDTLLEDAIADFLTEQKLVGEFLMWLEKWKSLRVMA